MANVVQIIATNDEHPDFESSIINDAWHVVIEGDAIRTACGIQLEGDDGYAAGPTKTGYVTCPLCLNLIRQFKKIRKWRPPHDTATQI